MGLRRKARESALQMLFAADVATGSAERPKAPVRADELVRDYWSQLGEELDEPSREFATRLVTGTLAHIRELDERIKSRAEHWRISRMAIVDRNVLRLAVYEFLYEPTPRTVAINEALEVARRFSTYEATQFINGILDAVKRDLDEERPQPEASGATAHDDEEDDAEDEGAGGEVAQARAGEDGEPDDEGHREDDKGLLASAS
jgi:N utilization substance protein B